MGMSDTVVVLDPLARLCCPDGHVLRSFRTKDIGQPGLNTYLLHGGRLYLASAAHDSQDDDDVSCWRVAADRAVYERRYQLREVAAPRTLHIYGSCKVCEPVLVRTCSPSAWGDIVGEHALFVDFKLTLRPAEPLQIEHVTGTRDQLKRELREQGAYVLDDDDPLATAHRTLQLARARPLFR